MGMVETSLERESDRELKDDCSALLIDLLIYWVMEVVWDILIEVLGSWVLLIVQNIRYIHKL